jgi:hypothetical protein
VVGGIASENECFRGRLDNESIDKEALEAFHDARGVALSFPSLSCSECGFAGMTAGSLSLHS